MVRSLMISRNASSAFTLKYRTALLLASLIIFAPAVLAGEWKTGGHLKYFFSQSRYDTDNIFSQAGTPSPTDQSLNFRLTAEKKWESNWDSVIHYEVGAFRSDSIETARLFGALPTLAGYGIPNDSARLFNLTSVIVDEGKNVLYQRLDRVSIGYTQTSYVFRFGRQAVSWGNGMVFQPMDIFNPFSPTAIDKEYKTGDDMVYMQNLLETGNDIQTVLIPRRNITTGNLEADESSLAVKYHSTRGAIDIDLLVSRHFGDNLAGFGFSADWKGAILRGDLVNAWNPNGSALSAVTSINYAWVWGRHNVSGFFEYYRNGYGISDGIYDPLVLVANPALISRISRGELFTLGRDYLAAGLTVELTPRWLFNPLLINNMNDGSWLTQWIATFDWKQDLKLLLGTNLPVGNKGTEYGGIPSTTPGEYIGGGRSAFLQLAYYF
ncbi:MAG: hypothetical protein ACC641_09525 [Acidiferrobacterales bacterium]